MRDIGKDVYDKVRKPVYEYKYYKTEVADRLTILSWFLFVWILNVVVQALVDYTYITIVSLVSSFLFCFGGVTLLFYVYWHTSKDKDKKNNATYKMYLITLLVCFILTIITLLVLDENLLINICTFEHKVFSFYALSLLETKVCFFVSSLMAFISLLGAIKLIGSISLIRKWKKAEKLYKKHDKFNFKDFDGTEFECLDYGETYRVKDIDLIKCISKNESVYVDSFNMSKELKNMVFSPYILVIKFNDFASEDVVIISGLLMIFTLIVVVATVLCHYIVKVNTSSTEQLVTQLNELEQDGSESYDFSKLIGVINTEENISFMEANFNDTQISGDTLVDFCNYLNNSSVLLYVDIVRDTSANPHRVGITPGEVKLCESSKLNEKIISKLYKDTNFRVNLVYDYTVSSRTIIGVEAIAIGDSNLTTVDSDNGVTTFNESKLGESNLSGSIDTEEEIKYLYGLANRYTSGKEIKELAELLSTNSINVYMDVKAPNLAINVDNRVGLGTESSSDKFWEEISDEDIFVTTLFFKGKEIEYISAVME